MATALELGYEGWQHYLKSNRHRTMVPQLTVADQQAREAILHRVREAAQLLKSRYKAKRVVLFGSLAHEAWFNPHSDVDLAVEALPSDCYWQAWSAVEKIIGDRAVDLVELESASESMQAAIERNGIVL
ncbi:MAG: nucleotidyltransferase domain-containing protein [Anaerolineae bacterium]|nr:nucleotidyltransferase domain-containing protein [Anaerolineae bacterium]